MFSSLYFWNFDRGDSRAGALRRLLSLGGRPPWAQAAGWLRQQYRIHAAAEPPKDRSLRKAPADSFRNSRNKERKRSEFFATPPIVLGHGSEYVDA